MRFCASDYKNAIRKLCDGLTQLEPDGENCAICGDCGHQAMECPHNPLVQMARPEYKCFHCGEELNGKAAEEHFGIDEFQTPACIQALREHQDKPCVDCYFFNLESGDVDAKLEKRWKELENANAKV